MRSAFENGRTLQENLVRPNPQFIEKLKQKRAFPFGRKIFFDADDVSKIPVRGGTSEEQDLTRKTLESFQEMRHPEGRFLPLRVKSVNFANNGNAADLGEYQTLSGDISIYPKQHSGIIDELGTIAHEPGHGLGGTATQVEVNINGTNTEKSVLLNQGKPAHQVESIFGSGGLQEFVAHSNALAALQKAQSKFRKGSREWELYEDAILDNLREIRSPGTYPRKAMQNTINSIGNRRYYKKEDIANYLGQLAYLDDTGKPGKMLLPDGVPLSPEMEPQYIDFLNRIARKGLETLGK